MDNGLGEGHQKPMAAVPDTLTEEIRRMMEVPGIYFATEATGRVAKVQGTGLGVWEVIRIYRSFEGNVEAIVGAYPHLTLDRIQAALRYANLYPEEIESRIRENEELSDPTVLRSRYPELADRIIVPE